MIVNKFLLISNPFFNAYLETDLLGKLIFIGLVSLSIISWALIIYKSLLTFQAKKASQQFQVFFQNYRSNPLTVDPSHYKKSNPYLEIYQVLKRQTVEILNKNRRFGQKEGATEKPFLSITDIELVEGHLISAISLQTKNLEKHLYILSTVVTLAPFLGLLGTVWGILVTFSNLQMNAGGNTQQLVLSGLSLALATTVLGLLDAIPALIGYNYLKHSIKDFQTDMESFSNEALSSIEIQYRQVDVK